MYDGRAIAGAQRQAWYTGAMHGVVFEAAVVRASLGLEQPAAVHAAVDIVTCSAVLPWGEGMAMM